MGNTSFGRRARGVVASALTAGLLIAGLSGVGATAAGAAEVPPSMPPQLQRDDNVVTSDPIPTVQIDNGYVWAQTTIGTTVYAVGKFDNAREPKAAPGTSLTARSNVLAYDIVTGALSSFAPKVNGVIKAVAASPDGSRIYIGGSFNSVNGKDRWNFAALDAKTGELVPQFAPSIGGSGVYAITTDGSNIYLGGLFTQANGVARKNLAAFDAGNGALLSWAPLADRQVDALVMDPAGAKVIVGGRFSTLNGSSLRGSAAVDKSTGAADTDWGISKVVKNSGSSSNSGIFALATDANTVYGTGWSWSGGGNLEGTFAAEAGSGAVRWIADCHGDHYGVYSTGKVVYTTSHMHSCNTMGLQPQKSPAVYQYDRGVHDGRARHPFREHLLRVRQLGGNSRTVAVSVGTGLVGGHHDRTRPGGPVDHRLRRHDLDRRRVPIRQRRSVRGTGPLLHQPSGRREGRPPRRRCELEAHRGHLARSRSCSCVDPDQLGSG